MTTKTENKMSVSKVRFGMELVRKDFNTRTIEGFVSMELSKRDFDICPPSAFNIKQFMENGQVWYNHQLWNDGNGNQIPIGKTEELYSVKLEVLEDGAYGVIDSESGNLIGFITEEKASALSLKSGDIGLWAKIRIDVDDVWKMIDDGRLNAFSWQGKVEITEVWSADKNTFVRMCQSVDLFEISVVTVPANERAVFSVVKSFIGILDNESKKGIKHSKHKEESIERTETEAPESKTEKTIFKATNVNIVGEVFITAKHSPDGHYHVGEAEIINGMVVGKTIMTVGRNVEDHLHAINAVVDTPITNKSNNSDHYHSFPSNMFKELALLKNAEIQRVQFRKFVLPFMDLPVIKDDKDFTFTKEDSRKLLGENENIDRFLKAFVWVNEDIAPWDEDFNFNPKAVQLPIAKLENGVVTVFWNGVARAMAKLFGADGGVSMSTREFRDAHDHLSQYYKKFGQTPPELKEYTFKEYREHIDSTGNQFAVLGNREDWIPNKKRIAKAIVDLSMVTKSKSEGDS